LPHVRGRLRALPLIAVLALPLLAVLPSQAAVAATGHYLGYLSDSSTGTRYVAYDGDGVAVFTSTPDAVDGALGAVTDSGPAVAYVTEHDTTTSYVDRLHLRTPDGTDTLVYSATPGVDISEPSIAPNGHEVLFALDSDTTSAILSVDAQTGDVRTIRSSTSTAYFGPSFSPDGAYLSWAQVGKYYSDVVVTRYATGAAQVISQISTDSAAYSDTSWAPNSATVVAVRDDYDASIDDSYASLAVIDVRSHSLHIAVRGQVNGDGSITEYLEPTWAADGQTMLMTKLTRRGDAVQGELVKLPPNQGGYTDPVPTQGYAGSPSAASQVGTDGTAPRAPSDVSAQLLGAVARVTFALPGDSDLADLVVTRTVGDAADTPTAETEVARVWSDHVDVPLPQPDTTYGISVFARDWAGNLSPAGKVSVTSAATSTLTVSSPPARIHWRLGVKLIGTLANGSPLPNEKVTLFARRAMTSTFVPVASSTTNGEGNYTLTYNPPWTVELQVRFAGSPRGYAAVSAKRVVTVVPAANLSVSTYAIRLGASFTLTGNVGPNHAGQIVYIQRKVSGVWRNIASTRLSSTSTFRLVYRPNARGTWEMRAYKPADGDHASTTSAGRTVQVR
jgi:Tol biopolymer transport system component